MVDPLWTITESRFDPAQARAYEGLFTLGSGLLHVRGSLEEGLLSAPQYLDYSRRPTNVTSEKFSETGTRWGTFNPGIRGNHPLLNRGIANLPFFLDLTPYIGDEKLDVEASDIHFYERTLSLKDAILSRRLTWETRLSAQLQLYFERFVSAAHPGVCLQRLEVVTDRPIRLRVLAGIDSDVRTSGYDMFEARQFTLEGQNGVRCWVRTNTGDQVWMLSQLSATGITWITVQTERAVRLAGEFDLTPGSTCVIEKRSAVTTSFDPEFIDPAEKLNNLAGYKYGDLRKEHARIWQKRWQAADVVVEVRQKVEVRQSIEGDDLSQLAIRASIFHLLRAHPDDPRVAIDPKAYAGEAYRGCYFWDTEIYLLPFYLYTEPARARNLMEYRIHSLPAARMNAANTGYRGARYAWEADVDGSETCPNWQYRDHEVHVTADVVYALAHYAQAAPEPDFLQGVAREVIQETARYWLDRVDWRCGESYPSLLGVMGPDEYTPISSNNSYTNRLAAFNLALAAEMGESSDFDAAEAQEFTSTASSLPVLRSQDKQLVLQCEEFEHLAEPAFERFWHDRDRPFGSQVAQEWLYRSKCLKQADVLMLMLLFPNEFSDAEVETAWDHYVPYTTHDSSLSAGVHAIIACRLKKDQEAWKYWEKSSLNDLDFTHGGAAEGIHIAGAGMNWQMVVFGFAGLSSALNSESLNLRPRLPANWSRLAFPLIWKGQSLFIDITHIAISITNASDDDLTAGINEIRIAIPPLSTSSISLLNLETKAEGKTHG